MIKEFKEFGDSRGKLVSLEKSDIPFPIERVFYIYGLNGDETRGNHAHYETLQYIFCLNGSCNVTLTDGSTSETFFLDNPSIGLFKDKLTWIEMKDFSSDCVLMVVASTPYIQGDYINDYNEYLSIVGKNK